MATDFETLARQYWGAWGEAMRGATPAAAQPDPLRMGTQAWQDAIDWWTRQAGGRPAHDDILWRFNRQASDWYAQMQQVAARFGGQDNTAAGVAQAWKDALGSGAATAFADMLKSMSGNGLQDAEAWSRDAAPLLQALAGERAAWLRMPAFGLAREHQERWQSLAEAQLESEQAGNAFNALLLKASESAFQVFEKMLAEREEPGRQIGSARALFDLWIDAAEQAYAEVALSEEYREAYGNLVNAQMRLRGGMQKEVELASASLGMPTRSELDGAHRKIAELERALRRLRDAADPPPPAAGRKGASRASAKASGANLPAKKAASARPPAAKRAGKAGKPRTVQAARKPPARARATTPAKASKSPTNGFSTSIPVAPVPLSGVDA